MGQTCSCIQVFPSAAYSSWTLSSHGFFIITQVSSHMPLPGEPLPAHPFKITSPSPPPHLLSIYFAWLSLYFFGVLGLHLWHMEVPRLEVILEPVPQPVQCRIRVVSVTYNTAHGNAGPPNPLSKARDRTHNLVDTSQICFCCATTRTPFTLLDFLYRSCFQNLYFILFFYLVIFGSALGRWEFLGQRLNSCHSSDPGHSSGNARSLITRSLGNS